MRLQSIEQFIAVIDAGSIRGASRRLGLSQPALTRALQQLEAELGVRLMQRSVRGISLTHAGQAFLARARVAGEELRKAADEARQSAQEGRALLSLGLSPVAASLLLPGLAAGLLQRRPKVRLRLLELTPSALLGLVRDEELELAITQRTRAHLDAGLKFKPLFEIQMRVAVRPGHPLVGTRALAELAGADWLYMTAPGISDDITSQSFLREGLPAPEPAVHCGSYFAALDLIAATDLLAVLPPPLLTACISAGRLVEVPLLQPLVPLHVGIYTRADSPPTRAAKAAIDMAVAQAARTTSGGALRGTAPLGR